MRRRDFTALFVVGTALWPLHIQAHTSGRKLVYEGV
jgi:hypothetical protein